MFLSGFSIVISKEMKFVKWRPNSLKLTKHTNRSSNRKGSTKGNNISASLPFVIIPLIPLYFHCCERKKQKSPELLLTNTSTNEIISPLIHVRFFIGPLFTSFNILNASGSFFVSIQFVPGGLQGIHVMQALQNAQVTLTSIQALAVSH